MDLADDGGLRFEAYVDGLAREIGHKDREGPLRDYCLGLMMPCERKSVEPLAAVTSPARAAAQHQSLLHFIGQGGWSDERLLAKVRQMVLPAIERHGAKRVEAETDVRRVGGDTAFLDDRRKIGRRVLRLRAQLQLDGNPGFRTDTVLTALGDSLPTHARAKIARIIDRLELLLIQITELEQSRDAVLEDENPDRAAS